MSIKPVVALIGRPNVGKSTLFNQFTKSRQALVADLSGLTRDRQYGDAVYENKECRDRVSRAATPPLQRQFEEPLQGFHVVKPNSFQPR